MRTVSLFALLCAVSLLLSCGSTTLSDKEAIDLIRASSGYPKLESITLSRIRLDSPLGREIARLVRDGFLIPGDYTTGHAPTDRGKDLVEECFLNSFYGEWTFRPFTHSLDVARIVDKRIDKEQGTAVVMYEVVSTPTPYFSELWKLDSQLVEVASSKNDRFTAAAYFQRWEKGWRIVHIER